MSLYRDCQNWLLRSREAWAKDVGPILSSFLEVSLGILVARDNLDNDSLFHVELSSPWISLVSHASFRDSQNFWRFGIAKPPFFRVARPLPVKQLLFSGHCPSRFWALPFQSGRVVPDWVSISRHWQIIQALALHWPDWHEFQSRRFYFTVALDWHVLPIQDQFWALGIASVALVGKKVVHLT